MANKLNSLAHTKWLCKYHIVLYKVNPHGAIQNGSTGIFCLSITCQYKLLTHYLKYSHNIFLKHNINNNLNFLLDIFRR